MVNHTRPRPPLPATMKTIVYLSDNSIEATVHADTHIANGIARLATAAEVASYEAAFKRDDAMMAD